MKALVYQGPGKKAWQEVPNPRIQQPTDAVVRIETTTICGTDVHILRGEYPVREGLIVGHEPGPRRLGRAERRSGRRRGASPAGSRGAGRRGVSGP